MTFKRKLGRCVEMKLYVHDTEQNNRFVFVNRLFDFTDRIVIKYEPQFTVKRFAIWHSATIGFGSCLLTEE